MSKNTTVKIIKKYQKNLSVIIKKVKKIKKM